MTQTLETHGINLPADYREREREFDDLLKEAQKEFTERSRSKYSLPELMGDYRAVEEKPGLYMRPMCLEVELRALELYEIVGNGTVTGLARVGVGIAAAVLYRVKLPCEDEEARAKILQYVRGDVAEEEIFVPLTESEVGRIFKDTDELKRLVLDPLDISILRDTTEDADPNA